MNRRFASFALVSAFVATSALAADTYTFDKVHTEASFQVRHMVTKVRGKFTDFAGTIKIDPAKPEASSVEFAIKTASVATGEEKRDQHLKSADFFDVEKFPELTFKSSAIKATGKDKYDVAGTLTIHGVSKQVTLPVSFLGFVKSPWGDERAGFETGITLNRKDYGLVWNKTLETGGLLVGEEVEVSVNIEAVKQKETASK
ncbi:MAG: YceI family protein [Vicinamibacteria bacterium]